MRCKLSWHEPAAIKYHCIPRQSGMRKWSCQPLLWAGKAYLEKHLRCLVQGVYLVIGAVYIFVLVYLPLVILYSVVYMVQSPFLFLWCFLSSNNFVSVWISDECILLRVPCCCTSLNGRQAGYCVWHEFLLVQAVQPTYKDYLKKYERHLILFTDGQMNLSYKLLGLTVWPVFRQLLEFRQYKYNYSYCWKCKVDRDGHWGSEI